MKGIVETVAGVVERLSLSSAEKKRLEKELTDAVVEYERLRVEQQGTVVRCEVEGNWLQRSWGDARVRGGGAGGHVRGLADAGGFLAVLGFA